MKKVYRDCLAIGMHPEMHIYISKEIENTDALAASFEGLGFYPKKGWRCRLQFWNWDS